MADAHGSGPCAREGVGVQVPPRAQSGSWDDQGLAVGTTPGRASVWSGAVALRRGRPQATTQLDVVAPDRRGRLRNSGTTSSGTASRMNWSKCGTVNVAYPYSGVYSSPFWMSVDRVGAHCCDVRFSNLATSQQCAPTRSTLIQKGLLYTPEYGYATFTVPHFDQFMRRAIPELVVPELRSRPRRSGATTSS